MFKKVFKNLSIKKYLPLYLFFIVIFIYFFGSLFYPELKIYSTPDFGRSEIWSLEYPLKDFLSNSLKKGQLPFWSKDVGGGYPIFAQGLVGTLFVPNLILFSLLPTPLAWNLSIVLIFVLIFAGSFLFINKNINNTYASFFASMVFTFSGFNILHIFLFPFVQAISVFPFVLLSGQTLWQKPTKLKVFVFAFLLSQQIFTGHPQVLFMTLIAIIIMYLVTNQKLARRQKFGKTKPLILATVFGLLLALPQILPSLELFPRTVVSVRGIKILDELSRFPYQPKYLLTTIFPNLFGTSGNGSFSDFNEGQGIYWEVNSFVGIIPVALAVMALVRFRKKKTSFAGFSLILFLISIVLLFGSYFPFNLIYLLPGFNLFRVPSRFLLLSVFSLSALSGIGLSFVLQRIKLKRKILYYGVFWSITFMTVFSLMVFGKNHNPTVSFDKFLEKPAILDDIKGDDRIFTDSSVYSSWNQYLKIKGWEKADDLLYFQNNVDSYTNLLFGKSNVGAEISAPLKRQATLLKYPDYYLLGSAGAKYLIATRELPKESPFKLIKFYSSELAKLPRYYLYENKDVLPRIRFVSNYEVKPFDYNLPDWDFNNKNLNFSNAAMLEQDLGEVFEQLLTKEIEIITDENQKLILKTTTDKKAILVIVDTPHPSWRAFVNGKREEIYNANIFQRAIIIPSGENVVEMKFVPISFYIGVSLSFLSIVAFITFYRKLPR